MKIAVLTSDARMKVVHDQLSKYYETIDLHEQKQFLEPMMFDVLVLPVKGITDDGNFKTNEKNFIIPIQFWKDLKSTTNIFCGIPQPFLETLPNHKFYYMKAETVLEKNATLTAEGILFLLIDNTAKGIQYLNIDIIGYGRCGKEIYKWLKALHIPCRIIRRKKDGLSETISVEEWKRMEPYEVVINTSVQSIIDKELIDTWSRKPLIIDIATPEVIDGKYAQVKGIKFIKAGNLPALIAFESAGELVANYIRGILEHGK